MISQPRRYHAKWSPSFSTEQPRRWLSDDRLSGIITPEDNEWGDSMCARRVIKAGLKYWAIVVPKNAVGSMQMLRLANEYRARGVTVSAFADWDTALAWITAAG